MTFINLYQAGSTRRWHTNRTIKDQDLAQHQWAVAMICREILPGRPNLIEAALTHDLGESVTGDTPYVGKTKYPRLKEAVNEAETEFAINNGLIETSQLTPLEQHCLRWADMFEAFLFAIMEVGLGNQHMQRVVETAIDALRKIGYPNARAEQLYKEAFNHE